MWYLFKYYILIHQTYRITLTWHYFVEIMQNTMLCMTLEVRCDLMLAQGFYTSPTCSFIMATSVWFWAIVSTRPHAPVQKRSQSGVFATQMGGNTAEKMNFLPKQAIQQVTIWSVKSNGLTNMAVLLLEWKKWMPISLEYSLLITQQVCFAAAPLQPLSCLLIHSSANHTHFSVSAHSLYYHADCSWQAALMAGFWNNQHQESVPFVSRVYPSGPSRTFVHGPPPRTNAPYDPDNCMHCPWSIEILCGTITLPNKNRISTSLR